MRRRSLATLVLVLVPLALAAHPRAAAAADGGGPDAALLEKIESLERQLERTGHALDAINKKVDDILWVQRVGDVADWDKVFIPTVPNPKGEETYGIKNERHPFRMWAYTFVPKGIDRSKKHPLLIVPHGGVHADFDTYYTHIIREMMAQGYVVVAPEYRGSTGYGKAYYESIDYGGLEVDDAVASRDWALDVMEFLDPKKVGIVGWSHGGLIALMAAFQHPEKFQSVYAGVPVSDLLARMGYTDDSYRADFSATYHIGKTANQDVEEYRRRSPVFHVKKLQTPLLIHTNTNDRDVNVVEVENLINALKAEGKQFQYRIYQDAPGGHSFNRVDTTPARESRKEIYDFLAKHLKK